MIAGSGLIIFSVFANIKNASNLRANIGQVISGGTSGQINQKTGQAGASPEVSRKSDIDQDGLPDEEEPLYRTDPLNPDTDGDGFLDGEEINSGHDPLIPGPDDLLLLSKTNLTQKLATLTVSGLHEGSLKLDNPKFDESINILVSAVLEDALSDLNTSTDLSKLNFSNSTKSNQERYIKELSEVYKTFLSVFVNQVNNLGKNLTEIEKSGFANQNIKNYYKDKAFEFQNLLNKLLTMSIPENWKINHINFLNTVGQLVEINSYIADGEADPIKAFFGLNTFVETLDAVPLITESYLKEIERQNLNVKSTIFEK